MSTPSDTPLESQSSATSTPEVSSTPDAAASGEERVLHPTKEAYLPVTSEDINKGSSTHHYREDIELQH